MRTNDNRLLVLLTAAAVAISIVGGIAAKWQDAQAAALTAAPEARQEASRPGHVHPLPARPTTSAESTASTVPTVSTRTFTTTRRVVPAVTGPASPTRAKPAAKPAVVVPKASVGDVVQFGSFGGEPIRWRILELGDRRIVLLSAEALTAGPFQADEYRAAASDYAGSTVRAWLREEFVPTAFGADAETDPRLGRSSATDAVAGDIAYLLTPRQLDRYLPEADDRVAASSGWAQENAGFGGVALPAGPVYWWLAPDPGSDASNVVPVVQTNGAVNGDRYAAIATDGVRPAIRLDASAVSLVPVAGQQRTFGVKAR